MTSIINKTNSQRKIANNSSQKEKVTYPLRLRLDLVLFLLVNSIPVGVNGLTLAAGGVFMLSFLSDDFVELMVNNVLILFLGAGVAKTGVMMAELFSRSVLGVAGESNNLRARTPLYGGDMGSRALERINLGFLGLVIRMVIPRPSSLPDESRRSDDELLEVRLLPVDASCKSSSSLNGNSSRCAMRQWFSSISISRSIITG